MTVYDCIASAAQQGAITPEEAERLRARYANVRAALAQVHAASKRTLGADLDEEARTTLQGMLKQEADRQRTLADLAVTAQSRIRDNLFAFRDAGGRADIFEAAMRHLENFGFTGFSSVRGTQMSIISLVHGEMGDVLRLFERNSITGFHHNNPAARNVVREMLGEASNDPAAKAFADAATKAFETLRTRFNAAGGDIGHIEGGYLPQFHEPLALYRAGFETWRDFIAPRLAADKIKDPLTGLPITPERLTESLRGAYDKIITGGWDDRTPNAAPQGGGALAGRRAEERFFVFKSADDWLAYNRQFGRGDPIVAIAQHINTMARDIAALEVLGPNPSATIEWMKQVVQSEHGKALIDEPSAFNLENRGVYGVGIKTERGHVDAGGFAAHRIDDLWQYVRGRPVVSQSIARVAGDVRNVLTSIQLGSASITAAFTDPVIEKMTRGALDMPTTWLFGSNAKVFLDATAHLFSGLPIVGRGMGFLLDKMTGAPREQALRSGLIADEFLHVLGDEARYAGTLGGNVWSRWIADRTLMLSGLTPITESRRAVFALELQGWLADNAAKPLAELPPRLKAKMEGYGIDEAAWDTMRGVAPYQPHPSSAGLLRPVDVAQVDRAAAERMLEMILGETERAIPTTNLRSRERVTSGGPKGTIGSELMETFLQYRSFGLSLMTLQMEAIARESANMGRAKGGSYAAQLLILTTIGGAAAVQLKQMSQGKDPQSMKDVRFWLNAMATGGGLGLYGDFLFADVNRYGQSFGEQLAGPTVAAGGDVLKLTVGAAQQLAQGKDPQLGHRVTDFARRYTPLLSSLWYARAAYNRILLDQLQYQIDPQASRRWRENERNALRERNQGHFWPHGETAPTRLPDLSRALGQ